jgi:hypothetical protein
VSRPYGELRELQAYPRQITDATLEFRERRQKLRGAIACWTPACRDSEQEWRRVAAWARARGEGFIQGYMYNDENYQTVVGLSFI